MASIRMAWNRHGTFSKKIIRKLLALVVLLIGIRLVWVSFYSWNSPTIIKENVVQARNKPVIQSRHKPAIKDMDKSSNDPYYNIDADIKTNDDYLKRLQRPPLEKSRKVSSKVTPTPPEPKPTKSNTLAGNITEDKSEDKTKQKPESIDDFIKESKKTVNGTSDNPKMIDGKPKENPNVQEKDNTGSISAMFKASVDSGTCKAVNEWKQRKHNGSSTFDLFENVDYTMNDQGQYPIPVRTFDDINKDESQKPLSVILVPFSHADPGYGLTIEQYYAQMTHSTLDNMIVKLKQHRNMTFQWAESVYLARWFEDLNESGKQDVRDLIKTGQFEVVLGGWVMPDEASPNYIAVVDQLIEGHQWLIENLGVKPTSAWVNDPFGYSSTMPYLWKASGLDNLVFLRINQPVKAKLMKMKSLDFMWRPYWKSNSDTDLLSTLMSYTNYWVGDVCGPNPTICQQFNFLHLGGRDSQGVPVTEANVAKQARLLYEQFRITGDLYKYNTLYIGLGEDFSYPQQQQWDDVYLNYEKLINYINSQPEWKMTVKFGTLKEYFSKIRKEQQQMAKVQDTEAAFPILSGDFFPYTERNQEFWTGYFTTRPLNKIFSRELESLVRAAEIFNVVAYSSFKHYGVEYKAGTKIAELLRYARRELGMFMHHDGITGTSLPHVVDDYQTRLFKANTQTHDAFKMVLLSLLTKGKQYDPQMLNSEIIKPDSKKKSGNTVIPTNKEHSVVLINPMSKKRREIVSLYAESKDIVILSSVNANTPIQVINHGEVAEGEKKLPVTVSFEVNIPPFGIEVYKISRGSRSNSMTEVSERVVNEEDSTLIIENMHMNVEFDKKSGALKKITDSAGTITDITGQFMVYQSKASGAYIFGPAGPASAFTNGDVVVKVTKGPLVSQVKVKSKAFNIRYILYNTTGLQGHGLHIKAEVDMKAANMNEMEVILRFQTDVKNGDRFYTDQNGFQLIGRQNRPKDPIESNYYPVTTMIILEDETKRLSLHTRQPHGGASLKEGQLEVMLDRQTNRDDKRGLGQGVYDSVRIRNEFILHVEHKSQPFKPIEKRYTYASEDSTLMNEFLQNNIFKYITNSSSVKLTKNLYPLKSEFPCDVAVVGLRNLVKNNLEYNGTSLVLHRKPLHCGYTPKNGQCKKVDSLTVKSLFPKVKVAITETTLSHLYEKNKLSAESDLMPEHMELRAFKVDI